MWEVSQTSSINMIPENVALTNESVSHLSITLELAREGLSALTNKWFYFYFQNYTPVVGISAHIIKNVSDQTNTSLLLNCRLEFANVYFAKH